MTYNCRVSITPTDAWTDANLTHLQCRLLGLIGSYMGKNQTAWPSQKRLAIDLGCSRKAINEGIRALKARGYIDVKSQEREDGGQTSNLIYVRLDPLSREGAPPVTPELHPLSPSEVTPPVTPRGYTHKKDKEERQKRSTDAEAVFEFWNQKAEGIKAWTVHRKLTRKFRDMINARIAEYSVEDVISFIEALSKQPWAVSGKFPTDNLEYVCRPGTFAKHFDKLTDPNNQQAALPQVASIIPMGPTETIDELLAKRDAERAGSPALGNGQTGDAPADLSRVQPCTKEETLEMFERDPRGLEDARILSSL